MINHSMQDGIINKIYRRTYIKGRENMKEYSQLLQLNPPNPNGHLNNTYIKSKNQISQLADLPKTKNVSI